MSKSKTAYSDIIAELITNDQTALRLGFLAAAKGRSTKNPYREGTSENRAWTEGIANYHEKRIPLCIEDHVPFATYDKRYTLPQDKYFAAACATLK